MLIRSYFLVLVTHATNICSVSLSLFSLSLSLSLHQYYENEILANHCLLAALESETYFCMLGLEV
jgi:hypothetical protein